MSLQDDYKRFQIEEGHNTASYYYIMPTKYNKPDQPYHWRKDNYENDLTFMESQEISIEEDDVFDALLSFLLEVCDLNSDMNRLKYHYQETPEWEHNLQYNFFTLAQIDQLVINIQSFNKVLKSGQSFSESLASRNFPNYQIEQLKDNPNEITDFYDKFTARMKVMRSEAKKHGFDFITFMGP